MTGCYLSDSWKLNRTSAHEIASQNIDVDVPATNGTSVTTCPNMPALLFPLKVLPSSNCDS